MSDYTKLPRDIADCMRRAGSPLSEDQKLLLAGYLAPVQQKLAECEARTAELARAGDRLSYELGSWMATEHDKDSQKAMAAWRSFRQQADEAERAGGQK